MYNKRMKRKKVKTGSVKVKQDRGVVYLSRRSVLSSVFLALSVFLIVASLTAVGIPVVPAIWYRINPATSYALEDVLTRPVTDFEDILIAAGDKAIYQPPQDPSLSTDNRIIIEKLGVDTAIVEKPVEEHEAAFRVGVWRVPDFGTPYARERPTILAAHRFGYLAWSNEYRRINSFFNLPELEVGDKITMIWDQRKYTYEVYESEEAEQIGTYTADLILYTCKFLESDVRIFKYARLTESASGFGGIQ
jgi:hypothetical protein